MIINQQEYLAELINLRFHGDKDAYPRRVTEPSVVTDYAVSHPDTELGIIKNGSFYDIRLDLYSDRTGKVFRYPCLVYPKPSAAALVRINGLFALQWHYRPFYNKKFLEIPRGFGDPEDRSACDTMIRELSEECGIQADCKECRIQITPLGIFHADTGVLKNETSLFFYDVTSTAAFTPTNCDPTESISYVLIKEEELVRLIADGTLSDSFTLGAFMRYTAMKGVSK